MILPKYKTVFSSRLKVVPSQDKNKYLSLASLDNLRQFIPEIDERNVDLLPFSCSAYVCNHSNLNNCIVGTKEGVETADLFINKFVDLDHKRNQIIGVLIKVGFSEFGTEKLLTKEEASKLTKPFNITVGGIIYRSVSEDLADFLEETNDPTSPEYLSVSASFEIGFDSFEIAVLPKGSRNLEDAKIITDQTEIAKLSNQLKTFGGSGTTEKGETLSLLLKGNVLPLAIGLTENPAASVKGLAIKSLDQNEESASLSSNTQENTILTKNIVLDQNNNNLEEKNKNNQQIDANKEKIDVIENNNLINLNKPTKKIMKITKLKDITDEALAAKEINAAVIEDFVESELSKNSEKWTQEKKEKDKAIETAEEKFKNLDKTHQELAKELATVKESLKKLQEEKAAKDAQEQFDLRMAAFDEKYELVDADRKVIASQIKGLTDEAFASYQENMAILLQSKDKEVIAAAKKKNETQASTTTETNTNTVVENAIDGATKTTKTIPATTTPAPKTLKEKYAKAFDVKDGFELVK